MQFLVRIKVLWPPDGDPGRREELVAAEGVRARELADEGTLIRMWRIPGKWANVGIWEAEDATKLHEAVSSLPLFPWLDADVTPLADHPSDPNRRGSAS